MQRRRRERAECESKGLGAARVQRRHRMGRDRGCCVLRKSEIASADASRVCDPTWFETPGNSTPTGSLRPAKSPAVKASRSSCRPRPTTCILATANTPAQAAFSSPTRSSQLRFATCFSNTTGKHLKTQLFPSPLMRASILWSIQRSRLSTDGARRRSVWICRCLELRNG